MRTGGVVRGPEVISITDGAHVELSIPGELSADVYTSLWASGDLFVEKGSVLDVGGRAFVLGDASVLSDAELTVSNETAQYALRVDGSMSVQDSTVIADSFGDYGIVVGSLTASSSTVEAHAENSYGLWMRSGGATFDGGSVMVSSAQGPAMSCQTAPVKITNCTATFSGATEALLNTALDFGDQNWYQWATSSAGKTTSSADVAYDYADNPSIYLRIEPVGTTYELTVTGGEGSGSYVAGTEVAVSAPAYTAAGHFSGWEADAAHAGLLADPTSAATTFTVPVGGAAIEAGYNEPHALTHHGAKAPTCTEVGWEAYDECAECGYTTYKEVSATGHNYVNGVCDACGAKDPGYVAPAAGGSDEPDEPEESGADALPATGGTVALSSIVLLVIGTSVLGVGAVMKRHR